MEYTAIYNTPTMKGVEYAFQESNDNNARQFAAWKFTAENILIVNEETGRYIRMGETDELEKIYESRHKNL